MDARNFSKDEKRAWWPLFARSKAARHESLIGWLDAWRAQRRPALEPAKPAAPPRIEQPAIEARELAPPQPAPKAEPAPAPLPAPPPEVPALAQPIQVEAPPAIPVPEESLFARLKRGLTRSADSLSGGIASIFQSKEIDEGQIQELEDLLITADLGVPTAERIVGSLRATKVERGATLEEFKSLLASEVEKVLRPAQAAFKTNGAHKPYVVLVVGVNGTGKTTTIGKLANQLKSQGKSVMIAAGDTFRAAAIDQLKIWGERTGSPVIAKEVGADAAGLAFEALEKAKAEDIDILLIDTAGRLQNKAGLMAELEKINRVIKKVDPTAPHSVIQVLDATTGQNAISQVEVFQKTAGVTGLIMTKLDGTARGGILVPLTEKFRLPIHAIGVGEAVDDLQPFDAKLFARALAGLEDVALGSEKE
ncbi:MAG TPA: signal recognition particle-docking protein FtsY [Alphaproteobacteria bacterium]|nr:signal recognition particle-docking protein FtsY [Alphaproteobacteria bacterium]